MNRWFLTLAMPRFARAAQAVVAVSDFTGREVVSRLGADPARVHVIYEGVDDRFEPVRDPEVLAAVRARYNLRPPFILFVGAIEPRKNLPTLLRAFAALCQEAGFEHQLVVAGGKGWLYDEVYSTAAGLNLGERCVFPGRIADEDLPALYSAAEIYAHPAHFEGFGLPPLEAMACGTPVVTSDATSLPEVVGEAGLLVPPHDVGAWVAALRRLSGDAALRRRLSVEGLRRARHFRWEETARRTAELYREVAARGRGSAR